MMRDVSRRNVLPCPARLAGEALVIGLLSMLALAVSGRVNAQDTTTSAADSGADTKNKPTVASQAPAKTAPQDESALKKAVKQKRVLTEDDLSVKPKDLAGSATDQAEFNPVCNADCEELVREQNQVEPDHELEFRNKFLLATREIARDTQWANLLYEAIGWAQIRYEASQNRRPQFPRGFLPTNDAGQMWRTYKEKEGWVKFRIQEVGKIDPLRANIMTNQWKVAYQRCCGDLAP